MARKPKSEASRAVSQARKQAKSFQKQAKNILKRAQLNVREYRKELAALQKQQLVAKRIETKTHKPTRYMLRKIKTFKGVATGHELAVPVGKMSPHRAREYTEKGIAQLIDKYLVFPKTAVRQRADIYKGRIRTREPIGRGELQVIKFPTRLEDMHDVMNWLSQNEQSLMELKGPRDQFGFQLQGHNSLRGLPSVKDLIAYLSKYDGTTKQRGNIFNGHSKIVRQEFVLFRFRPAPGSGGQPELEPYYGVKRYSKKKGELRGREKQLSAEYHKKKERERKARYRLQENQDEHDARIERQRAYDRSRSNERREARMGKRLMGD